MQRILSTLGLTLILAGCTAGPQVAGQQAPVPVTVREAIAADPQAVVANAGEANGATAEVTIVQPSNKPYDLAAVIHRWEPIDIFEYEVTLMVDLGVGYVALTPPMMVVVPQKVSPKTKAVFTNLRQGFIYQATVVAKGNDNGTAATTTLNAAAPTTTTFDFRGANDIENTLATNVTVTLDAAAFNGSGAVTIDPPASGVFTQPVATEAGVAQ